MSKTVDKLIGVAKKIHNAYANGKEPSNEDLKYYFQNLHLVDEINDASVYDMIDAFTTNPNFTAHTTRMFEANEKLLKDQKIQQNLALANTIWDIGLSIDQIASGQRSLEAQIKPSRPSLPQIDPTLQSEIDRSLQATYSPDFRELEPTAQQIAQTYQGEIDQARTASGGQAGIYGALGQVAASRRQDAGRQLIPMASQLREQDRNRLQSLLGMRMGQQEFIDRLQEARYGQDLDQYMMEQQAAGQLGAVGRQNLARSRGDLFQQLGPIASQIGDSFRGMKVGDEEDDMDINTYEEYIQNSLLGNRRFIG